MMSMAIFKKNRLYEWIEKKRQERDPFYSEENVKAILEAKAQLDRGEGIEFDINAPRE